MKKEDSKMCRACATRKPREAFSHTPEDDDYVPWYCDECIEWYKDHQMLWMKKPVGWNEIIREEFTNGPVVNKMY